VQPLPNPFSWYAHQLPEFILRAGTAATLAVEILVPLMMFMPRQWRFTAAWITILWQVLIILTSNHNWINLLTIILCLFLFDDKALNRVRPARLAKSSTQALPVSRSLTPGTLAVGGLAVVVAFVSFFQLRMLITGKEAAGFPGTLLGYMDTWRIINMYHVFPTMTTQRIELEISGSRDGIEWEKYHFKYKPDEPDKRPAWIMPHQPRLDWQMWFVPLHPKHLPWFEAFIGALMENRAEATGLLEYNPFPDEPPRYIHVDTYRYTFTTPEQREATGNWWNVEATGPFLPLPGAVRIPAPDDNE
jgi:hypothetical protein